VNGVVPLAVKRVGLEVDLSDLLVGDAAPLGVATVVDLASHAQTGLRRGRRDEAHDDLMGDQRLASPVLRDEREEAVLDLVPLARTRRQVTHGDGEAQLVGEALQLELPEAQAVAIAAAAVRGDHERRGLRIDRRAHLLPPRADRLHRELAGVVADADTHPRLVLSKVVDAVGRRAPDLVVDEVVHQDFDRVALRSEFTPTVLVVSHQLALLGVHRDRGLLRLELSPERLVDVLELRVAIWMLCPFETLAIGLQAVAELLEQLRHDRRACLVPLFSQRDDKVPLAARGPQEGRLGVAARRRFDQRLEVRQQRGILLRRLLATTSGSTASGGIHWPNRAALQHLDLADPVGDGARREPRCARDRDDTTVPVREGFARREESPCPLRQIAFEFAKAFADLRLGCRPVLLRGHATTGAP
jgi:hypothetical protein